METLCHVVRRTIQVLISGQLEASEAVQVE